jgi:hypothetical protein
MTQEQTANTSTTEVDENSDLDQYATTGPVPGPTAAFEAAQAEIQKEAEEKALGAKLSQLRHINRHIDTSVETVRALRKSLKLYKEILDLAVAAKTKLATKDLTLSEFYKLEIPILQKRDDAWQSIPSR